MSSSAPRETRDPLRARLAGLTLEDEHRLGKRLDGTRRTRDPQARERQRERIADDVAAAEQRIARRRAAVPALTYPEDLPVSARRDDIAAALRNNQVVIVAGETGSGKTTQLPKIALELGRGVRGRIGHTQPRRIAARTVAERIAEELGTGLGSGAVGWKVRFTDAVGDTTLVKLMTDGVLLAEIAHDRLLRQYDTIILDEAHERSLNIDFLLGYLARLLPRRPDLKLVITSATIDVERVAKHFGDAPVVEVSGRTYPVEIRYRPVVDPDDPAADPDRDQVSAIVDAVDELCAEGPGDILVFLAGEREIRDTAEALADRDLPNVEVLPLYSRLSAAEQHRVFAAHTGRRVVLATNVAETSLTVPGIRYVVDTGTARISRYSHRTKVQRLPIEPVSQASARQRSGRCGRLGPGIAIRLYTEEDFLSRPEYTDPEILRTNLASVLLQMASLDLGEIEDFPFIDPPDRRAVADGLALLEELGALAEPGDGGRRRLTDVGRALAALPLDPRLARMVVEADRRGVLEEVLVIAAGLTIQDPRERPAEHQQAADQAHARFADEHSDFLALLNLWRYLTEQQDALSGNQFRRTVKREFLHYLRIREWQDLHGQLRSTARRLGMRLGELAAEPDERGVHAALLAGLLSHVGLQAEPAKNQGRRPVREYLGARGTRFVLAPGTPLAKKPPRWVVAAELVETSRLFARTVARVDPEDVERLAAHLVKKQHSEPRWDAKRGSVVASERVTLYGIPLVVGRRVQYGSIDPVVSRELFIRHALVEGEWTTHHRFWADNQRAIERVGELEERARRRDIAVDDETLFELYDARIPADVVSTRHFDRWWKQARRENPDLLTFTPELLTNAAAAGQVRAEDYPDAVELTQGLTLPLSYAFAPGSDDDGVTVDVPLAVLDTVAERTSGESLAFTVPGMREELVTALLRTLPKQLRRALVPIPDRVREVLPRIDPGEPLLPALDRELRRSAGVVVPPDAWAPGQVPDHLRATFRVLDDRQRTLATGKDLSELRAQVAPQARASLAKAAADLERTGLTTWEFGTLPATVQVQRGGHAVTAYPALVDEGTTVGLRVVASEAEASRLSWAGARRLLVLAAGSPARQVVKGLSPRTRLALQFNPDGEIPALVDGVVDAAAGELVAAAGGPPRDGAAFAALVEQGRAELEPLTVEGVRRVEAVLTQAREVAVAIGAAPGRRVPEAAVADLRRQMGGLLYRGFVTETGLRRLPDVVRYLRGMAHRLEKLPANAARDALWTEQVAAVTAEYEQLRRQVPATGRPDDPVLRVRWMIEDLRVSLFAQGLGTSRSVSEQRIYKAIDKALGAVPA